MRRSGSVRSSLANVSERALIVPPSSGRLGPTFHGPVRSERPKSRGPRQLAQHGGIWQRACAIARMRAMDARPIIMVVDDERDFLFLTKAYLERHGFRVDIRTRAPSWVELLRIDPAMLLMDVELEHE